MQVKDTLTIDVHYAGPKTPITEIAWLTKAHECGLILVAKDNKLIEIIMDREAA